MIQLRNLPILMSLLVVCSTASSQQDIDYGAHIKPILSDNCYACHGPDAEQRVTDMRLDIPEGLFGDLGGILAFEQGNPDDSEVIRRILSDDPDYQMPPPDHRKRLTDDEKKLLVQWTEEGANWSAHWAFAPVGQFDLPEIRDTEWPLNFIDYFVLARLEQEELQPSARADKAQLARRLSFDLTGLPPSLEQLQAYLDDDRPEAYEALVDSLLKSPHFGERMAVYWLDLVRYADSVGYHGDQPVSVSPFRDYVINAFNSNMPFDQFTIEQLSGDLLDDPTLEQLIASGYNRLGMMSAEGGVQDEEYIAKYAADRVRTTSSVWLGVTLGCAECHDHKFDPFSTREFYEFAAFFADIKERGLYSGANQSGDWGPSVEVPDPELQALLEPLDKELAELVSSRESADADGANQRAWEESIQGALVQWQTLKPESVATYHEVSVELTDDDSIVIGGERPDEDCYLVTVRVPDSPIRAFRLEVLPHDSLPRKGPGRAGNGNFVVTEWLIVDGDQEGRLEELKAVFERWPEDAKELALALKNPTATIEQTAAAEKHPDKAWSANSAFDRDERGSIWGWAILPENGKPHELVVQRADTDELSDTITFVVQQYHGNGGHTLGHFRFSVSSQEDAVSDPLRSLPENVRNILALDQPSRNAAQSAKLREYYLSIAPELSELNNKIAQKRAERESLVAAHTRTSLITVSVPPREVRVLPRGNWMDKSGDVVGPNVPFGLGAVHWREKPTRLELAEWIVSKENPVTARVFVNRLWRMFFGAGISNILDDLGSQGEPPSHPQLLDTLAREFMASDWDVKHMVKTIVMSNTYQQDSRYREDLLEVDPENRLLARQSRYRIEAEFIRDHALATSGLLNRHVGGSSVKPYQPPGLYRHLNFPKRTYQASVGEDQYRRGLYTHWQRQYLHPAMRVFDAPPREECTAARARSSTPLGALVLLNDPSYVEAARAFADRAMKAVDEDESRLDWMFLVAFARPIDDREREVLTRLLNSHREFFATHPEEAKKLLATGQQPLDDEDQSSELAAWTSVGRAVMNMHEFVQRK